MTVSSRRTRLPRARLQAMTCLSLHRGGRLLVADRDDRARTVPDLVDGAVDAKAAVRERAERARHLERVDSLRAEADREVGPKRARDAEAVRGVHDVVRPDRLCELAEHAVVGMDRRLLEVDRAEVRAFVVGHRPGRPVEEERDRLRHERRAGCDAFLERGREHERLERRARLPLALHREVELRLPVVLAADHREHATVARIHRDQRRARRAGPVEPLRDRVACVLLHAQVDRRAHAQAAAEHGGRSVALDEQLLHVVREVRRLQVLARRQPHVLGLGQRLAVRADEVSVRDVPLVEHCEQNGAAPRLRGARVVDRIPARRILRDAGEQRSLGKVERLRAVAEVRLRRRLDAVSAVARGRWCSGTR